MIVVLGLVILVAAVIAGVARVLANGGHAHAVTHFAVFGYHVTGSTGTAGMIDIVLVAVTVHVGHGTGVATLTKSAARGEVGDVLTVPAGVKVLTAK